MSGFVYFIKPVGQTGPIKVGHSIYPMSRLVSLQTWSPIELEIISSFEGTRETEKAIHERFAHRQVRGEWFDADPDLIALAEGIRAGGKIEDLVDLSVKTGRLFRRPNTKSPLAKIVGIYKHRIDRAIVRASAIRGERVRAPGSVVQILNTAGGYRQEYRALTADEVETLEKFIADCRAPKQKAVAA